MGIREQLESLDKDELIDMLAGALSKKEEAPQKSKRRQNRGKKKPEQQAQTLSGKGGRKKKSGKKRRGQGGFDVQEHRRKRSQGRRGKTAKNFAPPEPMVIPAEGRPNLFLDMPVSNQFKDDVAIDKKLSGGVAREPRRGKIDYIEMECSRCGEEWEVLPSQLVNDPDEGYYFICDECGNSR